MATATTGMVIMGTAVDTMDRTATVDMAGITGRLTARATMAAAVITAEEAGVTMAVAAATAVDITD